MTYSGLTRTIFLSSSLLILTSAVITPKTTTHAQTNPVQTNTTTTPVQPNMVLPVMGTKASVGRVDGVEIDVKAQLPSVEDTPLQVICLFEYIEGDTANVSAEKKDLNGIVHIDEALHNLITDLRKSGKFQGKYLETLLLVPPRISLHPKKLLLIGLGNRTDFKPEMMEMVGIIGMREALRLGVLSYSHASDLKDQGVDSKAGDIAGLVVQGAIEGYRTQSYLQKQQAADFLTLNKMTLLVSPENFDDAKSGIKKTIDSLNSPAQKNLYK